MDPQEASKYLPLVENLLSGNQKFDVLQTQTEAKLPTAIANTALPSFDYGFNTKLQPGTTAIIPIIGPILKYSEACGQIGLDRISYYVETAKNNPDVSSLLFVFDSGGGQAAGVQDFNALIKSVDKPKIGIVKDGVLGSAAYWIGSTLDEIWATTETSIIGSIGAMVTIIDPSGKMEKEGIKIHHVYADKSKQKNKVFADALDGNYKGLKSALINPFQEAFEKGVRNNRGEKITNEEVYEGGTYLALDAQKIGLIDNIGSVEEAIQYLQTKTEPQQPLSTISNNSTTTDMKFSTKFKTVLAAIGFGSVTSEEEAPLVTEERLEQLDSSLATAHTTIEAHAATIKDLQSNLATAQESLATTETARAEAQAKADKYAKQAGAEHTTPVKGKPEGGNAEQATTEEEVFAAYPHNKEALNEIKNI